MCATIINNASEGKKKLITVATHDMQCYHGVAEREEKAGKLSHNTQSELFGTSADSVAMVVAAIYNTSSVIF